MFFSPVNQQFFHTIVLYLYSPAQPFPSPPFPPPPSGPDKDGYHIGKMNNIMEVFGDEKKYWLLPISTCMGDGISYPTRINTLSSYNSMATNDVNHSHNVKLGEFVLKGLT